MYAEVGDRLVVGGDPERIGLIIGIPHDDGTPPYVVKWAASGHIAMVMPGQFGRVIRTGQAVQAAGTSALDDCPGNASSALHHSDAAWSGTNVWDSRGART